MAGGVVELLKSTVVYDEYGKMLGRFLVLDAMVELMSPEHFPFAIVAISTLLLLIFMPTLLQLLYPMMWFQRLLNRMGLNSPGLRLYYRDRADGAWECRYFSILYPSLRIIVYFLMLDIPNLSYLMACFNQHYHCCHYPHSETIQDKVQDLQYR